MWKSLKAEDEDYYYMVQCGCGRKFRPEDMYVCYVCKKIKCQYCTISEGQSIRCKAGCTNQYTTGAKTKNAKFCCQNCLECPLCFSPLVTKYYMEKYYLSCPSCYWNSFKIKIAKGKKEEFEKYIQRLNEETCNGLLKKMYNVILEQLSKDPLIVNKNKKPFETEEGYKKRTSSEIVQAAMENGQQNLEDFENKKNSEFEQEEKKETGKYEYKDDYINNDDNKYASLKIVNKILSCYNDYNQNFNSLEDVKKAFGTNDLNLNAMAGLEQRHNNPIVQNNSILDQFPRFADLIPKKHLFNKRCKQCQKLIVEEEDDNQKKENRINHCFIKQLPIILINKIDLEQNLIKLRFIMLNFTDNIKISFKEDPYNDVKVILPDGKFDFELKEGGESQAGKTSKYKRILIDFHFDESYKSELVSNSSHTLRFIIVAEFNREENQNENPEESNNAIEYPNEIKFKIK